MAKTIAERPAPQDVGDLEPYLILRRRDDSFVVASRAASGVIVIAPLIAVPDPPRQSLIECPCCGRGIVMSRWPNGSMTLKPFKPRHGDGGEP